jgi:hypothetical protein
MDRKNREKQTVPNLSESKVKIERRKMRKQGRLERLHTLVSLKCRNGQGGPTVLV